MNAKNGIIFGLVTIITAAACYFLGKSSKIVPLETTDETKTEETTTPDETNPGPTEETKTEETSANE